MERRNYLKLLALSGIATTLNIRSLQSQQYRKKIKPKPLKSGDKVAVIAPSTAVSSPDDIQKANEILEYLELVPVFAKNLLKGSGYKTRTIDERIEDLHWAFENKDLKAVFCIRGGYGSASLLDKIDYNIIKNNPKIFCGYSDITALHLAINKLTGLITFHGPVLLSQFDKLTLDSFKSTLFEGEFLFYKNPDNIQLRNPNKTFSIIEGEAEGELIGGNLSIIASLMGTPYEIETDNKILFIEDVGEEPYRLHRMLTQLKSGKKLDNISGFVIGKCNDCKTKSTTTWDMSELEVYKDILGDYDYPIFYGLLIGHTNSQFTLPIGINFTINSGDNSLLIKENYLEF
jgi:muramoyltetrapeptide carboxypeptidase